MCCGRLPPLRPFRWYLEICGLGKIRKIVELCAHRRGPAPIAKRQIQCARRWHEEPAGQCWGGGSATKSSTAAASCSGVYSGWLRRTGAEYSSCSACCTASGR